MICLPSSCAAHLIQFHPGAALYHAMIDLTRGIRRRLRKKNQLCKYIADDGEGRLCRARALSGNTISQRDKVRVNYML